MPDSMIAAVEARAALEGQPLLVGSCLVFEWTHNIPINDDKDGEEDGEDFEEPGKGIDVAPPEVFIDVADQDGPNIDNIDKEEQTGNLINEPVITVDGVNVSLEESEADAASMIDEVDLLDKASDEDSKDMPYDEVDDEANNQSDGTSEVEANMEVDDTSEGAEAKSCADSVETVKNEEIVEDINEPWYNLRPNHGQSYGH